MIPTRAEVEARLGWLSAHYVPLTLEEALQVKRTPIDMSKEAVEARLKELSALLELTEWLKLAQPVAQDLNLGG